MDAKSRLEAQLESPRHQVAAEETAEKLRTTGNTFNSLDTAIQHIG